MTVFALLLLAHLMADFYLQKDQWIQCKITYHEKSLGLFKHISVHVLLTALALFVSPIALSINVLIGLSIIIVTHYAIDIWKTYQEYKLPYFLIDQVSHLVILALVSVWLNGITISQVSTFFSTISSHVYLTVAAFVLVSKPISLTIALALKKYTSTLDKTAETAPGLDSAGEFIGFLERWLIVGFILIGQFSGVGFLLAAKSVFRFGDMRRSTDRQLTEYIMLGTLMSFGIAILVGYAVKYLVIP